MTLAEWLESWRRRIDEALPALLPARHETAGSVHDAMAYALLSPGKRVRPTLIQAVGEMYRARPDRLMASAGAIEMVHTASLVLDDLPCMDDAATRRGRPSCHTAYGEATAILAAIGLLNHAFAVLAGESASPQLKDSLRADVARRLALAIGPDGVIGGQAADLASAGRTAGPAPPGDLATLEFIHSHKTGSLFIASAEIGAQICGATDGEMEALRAYAMNLGLAFQITDDLIDAVGDEESAGKPVRADAGRPTFVTMCGVEGARTLAAELIETAVASLAPFGRRSARLSGLARFIARRDR